MPSLRFKLSSSALSRICHSYDSFDMNQQTQVDELHRNWIWLHDWQDSSADNTSGRLVTFTRSFSLQDVPPAAIVQCTADTRYKLLVNGIRVTVGPSRSSPERWLYDTIDIAPFLKLGENVLTIIVLRYFYATRAAMPFVRTGYPGLTLVGSAGSTNLRTGLHENWTASVDNGTMFPMDLEDDVFLHVIYGTQQALIADQRTYHRLILHTGCNQAVYPPSGQRRAASVATSPASHSPSRANSRRSESGSRTQVLPCETHMGSCTCKEQSLDPSRQHGSHDRRPCRLSLDCLYKVDLPFIQSNHRPTQGHLLGSVRARAKTVPMAEDKRQPPRLGQRTYSWSMR